MTLSPSDAQETNHYVVDLDTGLPIRWHSCVRELRKWAAYMNASGGRHRYEAREVTSQAVTP